MGHAAIIIDTLNNFKVRRAKAKFDLAAWTELFTMLEVAFVKRSLL